MDKIIRQGDVMLFKVEKLPKGAVEVETQGDVILAFGEVTGHAHRIRKGRHHYGRAVEANSARSGLIKTPA